MKKGYLCEIIKWKKKTSPNKYKTKIIPSFFSNHNGMTLETNNSKKKRGGWGFHKCVETKLNTFLKLLNQRGNQNGICKISRDK